MASYNQYQLVNFLKKRRKYMTAKEIANQTNGTITTVNRKLNKMVGKMVEKRYRRMQVGKANHKMKVGLYRYKR